MYTGTKNLTESLPVVLALRTNVQKYTSRLNVTHMVEWKSTQSSQKTGIRNRISEQQIVY